MKEPKKVYCSDFEKGDVNCCASCHRENEFYKNYYKGIQIISCCTSLPDIKIDIDNHSEDGFKPENDCI